MCKKNNSQFVSDDQVKILLIYESAATFYIQNLLLWDEFKLSPDLTIIDISLDKTRFLLNQEVKNCQDQNIHPLDGGKIYFVSLQFISFLFFDFVIFHHKF